MKFWKTIALLSPPSMKMNFVDGENRRLAYRLVCTVSPAAAAEDIVHVFFIVGNVPRRRRVGAEVIVPVIFIVRAERSGASQVASPTVTSSSFFICTVSNHLKLNQVFGRGR